MGCATDVRNIREAFAAVGKMLQASGGVFAFPSPVGKPFIIAGDEAILKDVLIHHASLYGKQHANGILEIFRKTTLPTRCFQVGCLLLFRCLQSALS